MSDDREDPPPIPPGASAEQILQLMLPLVARAASDSAAAATSTGSALQSVEGRLATLEAAVERNTAEISKLVTLRQSEIDHVERKAKSELEAKKEMSAWLRQVFTPQTISIILTIIAAVLGLRMSLGSGSIQIIPPQQIEEQRSP